MLTTWGGGECFPLCRRPGCQAPVPAEASIISRRAEVDAPARWARAAGETRAARAGRRETLRPLTDGCLLRCGTGILMLWGVWSLRAVVAWHGAPQVDRLDPGHSAVPAVGRHRARPRATFERRRGDGTTGKRKAAQDGSAL